ncbi:MAG TPA: hypothetical protein VFF66_11660 [Brevundimonas sp.]|nr:hypothetical protein [Brevundimonas sp.]
MTDQLLRNIERLAAYTAEHPELRVAHHFLYDLRVPKDGKPQFVVMGVNPGETPHDWVIAPEPTEETSRYDFHDEVGAGRSAIRWSKAAQYFLSHADYVLAEIFFWSSYDSRIFRQRFGPVAKSRHLPICTDMNRDLINFYQPSAVVLPGLTYTRLVQQLYGLTHEESIKLNGVRVAERYSDGSRPWIFTKHWTAAFGFSRQQREVARNSIADAMRSPNSSPLNCPVSVGLHKK